MSIGRSDGCGPSVRADLIDSGGGPRQSLTVAAEGASAFLHGGAPGAPCIDVISSFQSFAQLREAWDAVYATDPEAQFFLSWAWMSQWLRAVKTGWFILAAKPRPDASNYVAFFPLRFRTKTAHNEIAMAGNRAADYTGFICVPEFQHQALPAFAEYIRTLNWARLNLEFIRASDERLRLFLRRFPQRYFSVKDVEQLYKRERVNNCICPYVKLPNDWTAYLNMSLSSNTRQRIRRFLRKIDLSSEYRITHATATTVEQDLETLLQFWVVKWGERKGDKLDSIRKIVRLMLTCCFEKGVLFLPVLWKGERPLGALASLVDVEKRSLLFYIGGRDKEYNNPPPGLVLHAYSIRYAISHGFATYDFLRGNEPYKYLFGAEECHIRHIVINARNRTQQPVR